CGVFCMNRPPIVVCSPPFYDELRRLGFVEGQNLIVEARGYALRTEQFPAIASELAHAEVDAILAGGAAAARAAQAATRTIPILTPERRPGRARGCGVTGASWV